MARISFQVQPIPGEKKFKDFQENFETIMETLLYLQNAFPKIIEDLEDPEDRYSVDVIIAFDADHIEAPDGQKGFGVFDTDTDRIYIAADIPEPEETLIETTGHEFMHYIQKIKGKPYSEEEAEHFAETVRYQVKRRITDTRAQTQPKKRHFERSKHGKPLHDIQNHSKRGGNHCPVFDRVRNDCIRDRFRKSAP